MVSPSQREHFAGVVVSELSVDTGADQWLAKPEFDRHLGRESVIALAADPGREIVVDHYPKRRAMNAAMLFAVSAALGRGLKKRFPEKRIGVALPPGLGAFIANLAITFAGKTPVNLNFTIGPAAASACLRKGDITAVISASALQEKVPDFPWPDETIDLTSEIEGVGKLAIVKWLLLVRALPGALLANLLGLPKQGGDVEAALLFTSGSSGEPKGVVLTHRNVLSNCLQIRETGLLHPGQTMIGCLPIFHSFGFTVTLWYPVLHRMRVATFPTPLETRRIAEIIATEEAEVLIGAPTFLRPFLKRSRREQMRSLTLVVAGAEKMPIDLYEAFQEELGVPIREGYGLTETTPVLAVNRPDPVELADGGVGNGFRLGSVGLLLPGIEGRVLDPQSAEVLPRGETGVLAVRGPNVFGGYLDDPETTAGALRDGWFITGDLARFDAEGFLYIEGRLSRFSKVGGEMVPQITVEQKIIESYGWQNAEKPSVVVVGVTDAAKGEILVALSTEKIELAELRDRLAEMGLPNLWIPRKVKHVDTIPTLGTGKLDLRTCQEIAAS